MRKLRYEEVKEFSQSLIVEGREYLPYPAAGFLVNLQSPSRLSQCLDTLTLTQPGI